MSTEAGAIHLNLSQGVLLAGNGIPGLGSDAFTNLGLSDEALRSVDSALDRPGGMLELQFGNRFGGLNASQQEAFLHLMSINSGADVDEIFSVVSEGQQSESGVQQFLTSDLDQARALLMQQLGVSDPSQLAQFSLNTDRPIDQSFSNNQLYSTKFEPKPPHGSERVAAILVSQGALDALLQQQSFAVLEGSGLKFLGPENFPKEMRERHDRLNRRHAALKSGIKVIDFLVKSQENAQNFLRVDIFANRNDPQVKQFLVSGFDRLTATSPLFAVPVFTTSQQFKQFVPIRPPGG